MPMYYFHIHGPNGTSVDDEGTDLADMAAVREKPQPRSERSWQIVSGRKRTKRPRNAGCR
jgi:hypothetical protein